MKTIAVIGAGGKSGQVFVVHALEAGYVVRAGVHSHDPFKPQKNLEVLTVDATKPEDVATLLKHTDVVASFIGHSKHSPKRVQTESMKIIIEAMENANIKNIISLTGTGVRFPGDTISILDRMMNASIALIDPDRIQDGIEHAEVLKKSDVDWTVLRVLKLTNFKANKFLLTPGGPGKLLVSRYEVAEAIMRIIDTDEYSKSAPVISS